MPAFFQKRPSDWTIAGITLFAFGILLVFGIWIQILEAAVLPSGYNVLHVEFAMTPERMDTVLGTWLEMNVLHIEVIIDQLDIFMMPGWSILFFGVQVLGLRALQFLKKLDKFRKISRKIVGLPLLAGGLDLVENLLILHVLTNPSGYIRVLVPIMFAFVMGKWILLFIGIGIGGIANIGALFVVIKHGMPVLPKKMT